MASTTAEAAARIRAALKSQGWGRKHVSVRSRSYSMGSSIDVFVKSLEVDFETVERVCECEEHIDRDQFGDILSGGNMFVFVHWDDDVREEMSAPWIEPIEAALAKVPSEGSSELFVVEGADSVWAAVGRREGSWMAQLWVGSRMVGDFTPDHVKGGAFQLACEIRQVQL